jgi:hypothetical protein
MSKVNEKLRVSPNQINEWTENPVTLKLLELVNEELTEIVSTPPAQCLHYGDPNKTQESLIMQDVKAFTFATIRLALEGDWEYFGESEDE